MSLGLPTVGEIARASNSRYMEWGVGLLFSQCKASLLGQCVQVSSIQGLVLVADGDKSHHRRWQQVRLCYPALLSSDVIQ